MPETIVKKADPKYDWKPVVEKLALGYRQVYGDQIDLDTITEFVREQHMITPLIGYEEWDWGQAVMEKLMEMQTSESGTKKLQLPDIPEPEPVEPEEPYPDAKKDREPSKKKGRKKKQQERVEQGHLEFSCYKSLFQNFSKKLMVAVDEILLVADDKGIFSRMVDPAHVLLVEAFIPDKDFYVGSDIINKKIQYNIDKPLEAGINLSEFYPTLKMLNSYDKIHCTVDETEMKIETISDNPLVRRRKPIEVFDKSKVPEMKFDVKTEVDRSELSMLYKATGGQQGSKDQFTPSVDKVEFISDGKTLTAIIPDYDDEGDMSIILSRESKGEARSLYSADYLRNILSALTESRPVTIQFSTDSPIKFSGKLQDSGHYMYLLAPRIETEE